MIFKKDKLVTMRICNLLVIIFTCFCCFDLAAQKFAIIGDYGYEGPNTKAVSDLVKSWNPDFVVSVGDDNYQAENHKSIDKNCGQYYHQFIGNYKGSYGSGSSTNRFFPIIGNADYKNYEDQPSGYLLNQWLNFFTLPNNERYYDYVQGNIHFFAINSNIHEPDGIKANSTQGQWIKNKLSNSTSKFKIVYMHQTPYSSAKVVYKNANIKHGSNPVLQWPFKQWGADVVISGDDHFYERNIVDNFIYIISGIRGRSLTPNSEVIPGFLPNVTKKHYNSNYGAILVEEVASENKLVFKAYDINSQLIDEFIIWPNKAQWRNCN